MSTFGQRLRAARESRGWTQEFVGDEVDVTKATVSKWERDAAQPSLDHLQKIRSVFSVSLDELICDDIARAKAAVRAAGMIDGRTDRIDPARAQSSRELGLLMWFRVLSEHRQRALLDLLKPEK